jgi:hypothetical protein
LAKQPHAKYVPKIDFEEGLRATNRRVTAHFSTDRVLQRCKVEQGDLAHFSQIYQGDVGVGGAKVKNFIFFSFL